MKIKYSEKKDKEFFNEVNKMGKQLSPIFGFEFSKIKFDKRTVPIAKIMTKVKIDFINEKKMKEVIKGIYGKEPPELTIYINTTPFSSWSVEEKYITISYTRNTFDKFFSTYCHEHNHFMYDVTFGTRKYEDTEIKETLTVLNNAFGVEDKGFPKFSIQRKAVLNFYNKNKDLKKTVEYIKSINEHFEEYKLEKKKF
ncbi:MAG: hypothetical protein Q8Q48_02700 [Candidatus Staskawiczbacteria bacterium]|nr:hypothetical protein [Candidatus Staskawiczbacteria bacterium]